MDLSTKYLPAITEASGSVVRVSRLPVGGGELLREAFKELTVATIPGMYDEITPEFAANILTIDATGYDPFGYFTLGKEVWVARELTNGTVAGFEVMTRKRGGSVKLGPTLILSEFRGRGVARDAIAVLEDLYRGAGARKVYVTAPADHAPTASLDLRHLRLKVEALLRDQYRVGSGERVLGRLLVPDPEVGIDADVTIRSDSASSDVAITTLPEGETNAVEQYLVNAMQYAYSDIDASFAAAVVSAERRGVGGPYEHKGKLVYVLVRRGHTVGAVVCTPKRGGAVKVSPVLLDQTYRSSELVGRILDRIVTDLRALGRRKLFLLTPVADWNLCVLLTQAGLCLEGILRSPYKSGHDVLILSRFL